MSRVWLEVSKQIPFLGFESIPALSVVCIQVFSPVGEADVFSNNEKEHMAKTHLRGGQSLESVLISNAVCYRRKKQRLKDVSVQCCYQCLECSRYTTSRHLSVLLVNR